MEEVVDAVDALEIEPQSFWLPAGFPQEGYRLDQRAFDHFRRLPHPKVVHGVGFPVGGSTVPGVAHLDPFAQCIVDLQSPWASEHLSFNRVRGAEQDVDLGFLLPPVQSPDSVALAASNIETVKAHLPVPFAFETGVSYLQPMEGELSDGAFFAAVADAADCGILLDLHNLWTNERNGRQRVLDVVDELPLERVWELHVAGGQELDGLWVDAHSGLAPGPVLELARQIVPRLPNLKAIFLEMTPEYVIESGLTSQDLRAQLQQMRDIWNTRGTQVAEQARRTARAESPEPSSLPSPSTWEDALASAVSGTAVAGLEERLAGDPGVKVLHRLIGSVRTGKVAGVLRLSTRLLLITLGEQGTQEVFEGFWRDVPSKLLASDEGRAFATYLETALADEVPFLRETVAFELAAHQALIDGRPQVLRSPYDIRPVIAALREGRLPDTVPSGVHEITVDPPYDATSRQNMGPLIQ